jgi:hypothetical protein
MRINDLIFMRRDPQPVELFFGDNFLLSTTKKKKKKLQDQYHTISLKIGDSLEMLKYFLENVFRFFYVFGMIENLDQIENIFRLIKKTLFNFSKIFLFFKVLSFFKLEFLVKPLSEKIHFTPHSPKYHYFN